MIGSLSGAVLAGAGAVGLVEAGVLPGRAGLDDALGWDGGGGVLPTLEPGPVVSGSFRSVARHTTVGWSILRPPGATGSLSMAVVLHGRDADHATAVTDLHYDRYLAAAVAGGTPPFALLTVDGGSAVYWHRRANGDDPIAMITDELLPIAAAHGLRTQRFAVTGWSMGGYGALLLGERLGSEKISAVAALSPAEPSSPTSPPRPPGRSTAPRTSPRTTPAGVHTGWRPSPYVLTAEPTTRSPTRRSGCATPCPRPRPAECPAARTPTGTGPGCCPTSWTSSATT